MSTMHLQETGITVEHVVRTLKDAHQPESLNWVLKNVTSSLLPKPAKRAAETVHVLLNSAVESGLIWKYGKADKSLYWHSPPQDWVQKCFIQRASGSPRSRSELIGSVSKLATVSGLVSKAAVEGILKTLVSSGRIQQHPPYLGSRTPLFCTLPVDPKDYLRRVIQQLSDKLQVNQNDLTALAAQLPAEEQNHHLPAVETTLVPPSDTTPAELRSGTERQLDGNTTAISSTSALTDSQLILQAMHEINPQVVSGGVVALSELRKRLDFHLDKAAFDRAVLDLARTEIAIHRDDYAGLKSSTEREALVQDDQGKYYNVVSLRRPS